MFDIIELEDENKSIYACSVGLLIFYGQGEHYPLTSTISEYLLGFTSLIAVRKESLQSQMKSESELIIQSVDWIEKELNKKFRELEVAIYNKDEVSLKKIKREIEQFRMKLHKENKNMDDFMIKYRGLINAKKQNLLFGSKREN